MRTKVIISIVLFVFGIAAFGWWSTHSRTVFAQIEATLASELTGALGTKVDIGQLHIVGPSSAAIDGVTIFDKQGRQMAVIEQATVEYNLLSLVRGQTTITALRKITLVRPEMLLVEEADATWNVACLKQETKPDNPTFTGKIIVKEAGVRVLSRQGAWDFTQGDAQIAIADSQSIDVKLTASHNGSPLTAQGYINGSKSNLTVNVKADKLQPAAYQSLLPAQFKVKFNSGELDNVDITVIKNSAGLSYAGEFLLNRLSAEAYGVAVDEARGRISFTNNNVYILGADALVNRQPVTVQGKIAIAGDLPVFDLNVASTQFDPAVIRPNLPFAGIISFSAGVAGTPEDLNIMAEIAAKEATAAGYRLQAATAKVKFAQNQVAVEQFNAQMAGGKVSGQGIIDLASQKYQVQLAASNLDAAAVQGLPVAISGRGDINLSLTGQGTDWNNVNGTAALKLTDGQLKGVPYTQMTAFVERTGSDTVIKNYNLILPTGLITANGTIQADKLNLTIEGQGIELAQLPAEAIENIRLAGKAGFQGQLTGTLAKPQLSLNFSADTLAINQEYVGQAGGLLTASPDIISFEQVTIANGIARHDFSGNIILSGTQPEYNLKLTTRSARAETIVRLIKPDLKLTGNIDHELTVTGPANHLLVEGKLKLSEGSLAGHLVDKAEGTYQWQSGLITVNSLDIDSLGSKIKLSGTVAPDKSLNFAVAAENIDVSRLKLKCPYPVSGMFNLTGQVTGNVSRPEATGRLTSSGVILNGQEVSNIYADLSYGDEQADIKELRFAHGQGNYVFNGAVDFKTAGIDGLLRVEKGELAGLLAIANMPDRGIRGLLNGEIAISGGIKNPNILLRGAITEGKIKNYLLDTIDINAELANNVITVNNLTAKQGTDGMLVVKGQADLNGKIDLEAGARSIDVGILAALFDTNIEAKGKFSFNAQATGLTKEPNVAVSLEVKDGSVANAEFDNLYGLLIFNKGTIHVNQLFVARGPYKASAYGIVPLRALNSQGRSKADVTDTMDLKLRLDNADLSILPLLTKDVAWAAGPTTGEITVGGTLSNPTLDGKVVVANGTIKLKALADPIQNVGVDIDLKDDKIKINAFDGKMGSGSYSLNGSARVNGLALDDYNITLTLDRLGIKHKYFAGPIDGVLTITSKKNKPYIQGKVTVDDATINIPAVPDSEELSFDAGLDVELIVGNKVRMYNPYLYDFQAEGKVKFSGTLQHPAASGRIEARRGTIKYLTNRFTIQSGSAEFIQFNSIEPVIKLQAQTKFERTKVNLNINGPITAMELKLTSEPAMSQQEIMSLLTLRGGYFSKTETNGHDSSLGRDELVSLLDAGLQMRFVAEVESVMQDALGVDEFRLVRSSLFDSNAKNARTDQSDGQFQGYNLEVGKYLTDKLLISYSMGIDQHNNAFGFRYDLTKNIGIGGSFGGKTKEMFTVETRFAF